MNTLRPEADRPRWRQVVRRGCAVVVANTMALVVLAPLVPGFGVDDLGDALLAGLVVGVVNATVWPAIAALVVPLSVLTLGLGAIVLNALLVGGVLDRLPGVTLQGFWSKLIVSLGVAAVTAVVAWALALEDDAWFDERMARRARRAHRARGTSTAATAHADVPGVVFVQIDGLSEAVLRRAMQSADVPTLHRWVRDGTHHIVSWETDWSSQTGVSQCGLLHGSTLDMPAFRWVDRATGAVVVSNHPASAQDIERRHSDGCGLLAHDGSSYGNLFSGDAQRAVLTMSGAGRVKEGRIGAGYTRYFSRPNQAARTLLRTTVEVVRERRAASEQRRRDVQPRVDRNFTYALLRAFTTVVSRDVCVNGVLNDMAEGRSAIYVDLVGYDEVAHHSGPERADTLAVLRDIDRQIDRLARAVRWCPRPYRLVVLSDHGQTQGPPFRERYGETLAEVVERLMRSSTAGDPDSDAGRTESTAWLRLARRNEASGPARVGGADRVRVLASGNLGLVYLPGSTERRCLEDIEANHPGLVDGLRSHRGIGFVLARTKSCGSVVLGAHGSRRLDDGYVEGVDPLRGFGPNAAAQIARTDAFTNTADLMVNSAYDAELDEVMAFEHQVSSHGGLGGPQTHPFLLLPSDVQPNVPLEGAVAVHALLKGWLRELGHPLPGPAEAPEPAITPSG
jgi:uncharacterized membrane protein YvlD (DUF360 family)